jgi:hypothetical protein
MLKKRSEGCLLRGHVVGVAHDDDEHNVLPSLMVTKGPDNDANIQCPKWDMLPTRCPTKHR